MSRAGETRPVQFLDLRADHAEIADELEAAWRCVLIGGRFVGGPEVEAFEEAWASYCGSSSAVGVANGTDAIELILRAHGVGPGDEVVVPTNTFVATAEAVVAAGAIPHFVDVDPLSLLITPETVAPALNTRTAAVIAVHLFGHVPDMPRLVAQARRHGLLLVEDAAQAHGASYDGLRAGSLADAAAFSFYPGKNLGAMGDGGAVTTGDRSVARAVRSLADHGRSADDKNRHEVMGMNSRLDALQAALLTVKLRHLDGWNARRAAVHALYREHLPPREHLRLLEPPDRCVESHHLEVVLVAHRDRVREDLRFAGFPTGIHYERPCHLQEPFIAYPRQEAPVSERAARRILSLPMHPHLDEAQVAAVCRALRQGFSDSGEGATA